VPKPPTHRQRLSTLAGRLAGGNASQSELHSPPHARPSHEEILAMPRHLLDLRGAKTIATAQLQLTCELIAHLVADRSVGLVRGPAGTGKSFAVAAALEHTRAIRPRTVTLESQPSVRMLANTLVRSFGGVHCEGHASFQATRLLLDMLADQPPRSLLVIDQAQQLDRECIAYLRYLNEHGCDTFALLLIGDDSQDDHQWVTGSATAGRHSRVARGLAFTPIASRDIPSIIRQWHRLYRSVDDEVLLFIDDAFGRGLFRNWVLFTSAFLQLFPRCQVDNQRALAVIKRFDGSEGT
jgi:AAA domain